MPPLIIGSRLHRRAPTATKRLSPRTWAFLVVAAAVALANLPYLVGFTHPDPLITRSGLGSWGTILPGTTTLDPNDGFTAQALTHRAMLDWLHLQVPWWNPYEGTGAPLAGEMEAAPFFPPSLLVLLANGQLFEHVLLELTAGFSTVLLLRRLDVSWLAATAASVAFALNGTFAWFAHAPVNPVPLLPLLLLSVERAYTASAKGSPAGWKLIAVVVALSVAAGFPEVAYIDGLLAVVWCVWRCCCLPRARRWGLIRTLASGAVCGALLSGPLLVAFADYLHAGDSGTHTLSQIGHHLPAEALVQYLIPYAYGPANTSAGQAHPALFALWNNVGGYLTAALVMLAITGLFSGHVSRGLRMTLCGCALVALSEMTGYPPLLWHILVVFPGMGQVNFYRFANSALTMCVVVLAAFGIDSIATRASSRRRYELVGLGVTVAAGVAVLAAGNFTTGTAGGIRAVAFWSMVWAPVSTLLITLAATLRAHRTRVAIPVLVVCIEAIGLFSVPEFSAPRDYAVDMAPASFLRTHLGDFRFFTLGPIQPNYGSYFGVASLNVNDIPIPAMFSSYVHRELDHYVLPYVFVGNDGGGRPATAPTPEQELVRNVAAYRSAGVRYVIAPSGLRLPSSDGTFTRVLTTPSSWIYLLNDARPLFSAQAAGHCRIVATSFDSVRVGCRRPTLLTRTETNMPGWRASVGGHAVTIHTIDGIFQRIAVSAGTHTVTFSYTPPHEPVAELGCLLAVLALLGGLASQIHRARARTTCP